MLSKKILTYNSKLKPLSRDLRTNFTANEKHLWFFIRRKQIFNVQFYRQRHLGGYIVDFYAPAVSLVIELDGSQHFTPEEQEYDQKRTLFLNKLNLEVLRFTNTEVLKNTFGVLDTIFNFISTTPENKIVITHKKIIIRAID